MTWASLRPQVEAEILALAAALDAAGAAAGRPRVSFALVVLSSVSGDMVYGEYTTILPCYCRGCQTALICALNSYTAQLEADLPAAQAVH